MVDLLKLVGCDEPAEAVREAKPEEYQAALKFLEGIQVDALTAVAEAVRVEWKLTEQECCTEPAKIRQFILARRDEITKLKL